MKKIGFIDYQIDEWHANNYPGWIAQANESMGLDYTVAYAWAEEEAPEGLLSTAQWCEKFGVTPCETLEELCEKSDVLLILAPSNPEKHLPYAETALKFGKRTYIDKTFAPDATTARRIYEMGEEYGTALFSTSALRYAEEMKAYDAPVHSVIITGGGRTLEEYVVHQLEMTVCLMSPGARAVTCHGNENHAVCAIEYDGGRTAVLNYGMKMPFMLDIQCAPESGSDFVAVKSQYFPALLRDILSFYETGCAPVSKEQTMECMIMREAVLKAAAAPGRRIEI